MAIVKEEADTMGNENTLFHRKTLLVIAAGDTEDITLELVTNSISRDLLRQFLVVEYATGTSMSDVHTEEIGTSDPLFPLIINVNGLLLPCCGVCRR